MDNDLAAEFDGSWRIEEMEQWNREAIDLLGPGFFAFGGDRFGQFRFIAVEGGMDCRYSDSSGRPRVDFSWRGEDDGRPKSGRGWAEVHADGTLHGRFYFHQGDESEFTATRSEVDLTERTSIRPGPRRRR